MRITRIVVPALLTGLFGVPVALAGDALVTQATMGAGTQDRPLERTVATLRDESRAMYDLVQTLKAETRAGRLDLSDEAKLAWQHGVVGFDGVESRIQVGDGKTALLAAAPARQAVGHGAVEAFSVGASEPVRLAVKKYVDAIEPRVQATRDVLRVFGRLDLEPRWWEARSQFEEARKLTAVDRSGRAWSALVVSAGMLDQLVLEAAYDVHEEPPTP